MGMQVFFDVSIADAPPLRIVFGLYGNQVPAPVARMRARKLSLSHTHSSQCLSQALIHIGSRYRRQLKTSSAFVAAKEAWASPASPSTTKSLSPPFLPSSGYVCVRAYVLKAAYTLVA